MRGLVPTVSRGISFQGAPVRKGPENSVEYFALFAPWSASLVLTNRIGRQDGSNDFPLVVPQVHRTTLYFIVKSTSLCL
jgi:hypothetical protein